MAWYDLELASSAQQLEAPNLQGPSATESFNANINYVGCPAVALSNHDLGTYQVCGSPDMTQLQLSSEALMLILKRNETK